VYWSQYFYKVTRRWGVFFVEAKRLLSPGFVKNRLNVDKRMEHGEIIGRGPNPQELLALLGALVIHDRLECKEHTDQRIGSDCKSLVDYVNEVGKLPFLLAIQQYLRQNEAQEIR
jgi:hypothetical protein